MAFSVDSKVSSYIYLVLPGIVYECNPVLYVMYLLDLLHKAAKSNNRKLVSENVHLEFGL